MGEKTTTGLNLLRKKRVTEKRYTDQVLFTYSTQEFLKKDKIRFYYALKGRDGKSGIVKSTDANHLGSAVILVDAKHEQEWNEFFNLWNIPFNTKKVMVEQ